MEPQTFTVTEASKELGVSVSTVRRWYDEYLTDEETARTPTQERKLSAGDMETLREVIKLRSRGLSQAAIKEELKNTVFPAPITESPQAAQEGRSEAIAPLAVVVEAMRSVTAPLESRQEAQEARLQALEAQRTRIDVVFIAVGAFMAGLIVGLAVWWFQ